MVSNKTLSLMRICLVSSSFYPATFYGGPISATWDLSKKLTDRNIEVFVSTTNGSNIDFLILNHKPVPFQKKRND